MLPSMNPDRRSGPLRQIRPAGDWTIAGLPDTQNYAAFPERIRIWECMTRWIVDNRDAYGIKLVLHVGDIVNENILPEWERARTALAPLRAQVPLVVAAGLPPPLPLFSPPFFLQRIVIIKQSTSTQPVNFELVIVRIS